MADTHDARTPQPHTPPTTGPGEADGGDVLDIIADVEGRLERLRKVSRESGAVMDSIHQKQAAIAQQQAALDKRAAELQAAGHSLEQKTVALDEREKHVESLCELADGERREIEAAKQALAQDRTALDREKQDLEKQQSDLQRRQAHLEREQAEIDSNRESLETARGQLKTQLAELEQQRTALESEHREAMQAVERRLEEITRQRDERAESLTQELDAARKQVAALSEHLEAQRAEAAKIEQSRRKDAEQAALRIDSLQADLEQAQKNAAALQGELQHSKDDLQKRCRQLEATKSKLVELGQALDAQTEQIEAGTAALAALEDRDRRIAELEAQLAAGGAGGGGESAGVDPAQLAARDERIAQLEREIQELEARVQAAAQTASASGESSDEEIARRDQAIEQLSDHIRSLQRSLQEAQAETTKRAGEVERLKSAIGELKSRPAAGAGSSGRDDEFTARRRQRIERMRRAIRDRSRRLNKARDVVKQQAQQVREIEDERRTLADVRRNLELAEQRMIRRWARSSVVTHLFLLTLTIAVLGAVSYFGVMTFWPTSYTARATIEAKGKPGFPLTETQTNLWQTVHEQMILSEGVVKGVAERLRQRGYTDLAEPEALNRFLESNLVSASPKPGTITLELTTVGRDEAQRLLETYSIGLVSLSNGERGRRTDGATTNLSVPATVDALPAKDNRVQVAGIAFGSSVAALLFLGLPLYLKLRRSASVFNDADLDAPMMDTGRWAQISAGHAGSTEHVIN